MFTKPGSRTCCRASKTLSICPEGDWPRLNISVITPLDTTMPSDASVVVPVNVASGCLIHRRWLPFFKDLNSLLTKPPSFYRYSIVILSLFYRCSIAVLSLFYRYSIAILSLFYRYSIAILVPFYCYFIVILLLFYCYSIGILSLLYCYSIAILVPFYCECIAFLNPERV